MSNDKGLQRRNFLGKAGLAAAAMAAGKLSGVTDANAAQGKPEMSECLPDADRKAGNAIAKANAEWPLPFVELDPEYTAQYAYEGFFQGACCYGVFNGLVGQWAELHGEPFSSIPTDMMKYGEGGVAGWGSTCGTINGAAAAINLVCDMSAARALINELLAWYSDTALPAFVPDGQEPIVTNASGSPLCHVSVSKWCQAADAGAVSAGRKERCARLVADVAKKTAMLLNAHFADQFTAEHPVSDTTNSCMTCHGKEALNTTLGKMECTPCHTPHDTAKVKSWNKF